MRHVLLCLIVVGNHKFGVSEKGFDPRLLELKGPMILFLNNGSVIVTSIRVVQNA